MATQRRNRRQEPANSLLYRPDSLEPLELNVSADVLLETTNNILTNQLNESQEIVFRNSFTNRVTLLWGPPGTGKTTLLGAIIIGWLKKVKIENQGTSIVVGSSNWNAIDNLLDEVAELIEYLKGEEEGFNDIEIHRVRGKSSSKSDNPLINDTIVGAGANTLVNDLDDGEKMIIVGSTWKQLHNLAKPDFRYNNPSQPKEWFDLVLIDEASQVKVSQAAQYFVLMKNIGNVIFAGDDKQLGPIFGFEIDNNSDGLYDCIYTYMKNTHNLVPQIIKSNYRSNEEIVNWPRSRFYDGEIEAINSMKRLDIELPDSKPEDWPEELIWNDNYLSILDPEVPIVLITYPSKPFTVSNPFESQITSALSWLYKKTLNGVEDNEFYSERLGIVTPHRAQRSNIQNILSRYCDMEDGAKLMVDTVDRFQGQEREMIIASYSVADKDFVKSEEGFILDPRRFNVSLTRAKSKFIMIISEAVINHLPSDREVAIDAAHIQLFALNHCKLIKEEPIEYFHNGNLQIMECKIKGNN